MGRIVTPADVMTILAAGDFDRLIEIIEDERVEFKEQPYHLAGDEHRMELAKDVSALANVHEGVIVLGPRTGRPDASRPQDEVVAVSPFPAALVDVEQYHRTLGALVFPALENIEIRWYPSGADGTRGVVAIVVPEQRGANRPFLTTKTLNQNNRLSERSFGLFERRRANADPIAVQEIHGWLRGGRAAGGSDALLEVVARLEAVVAAGGQPRVGGLDYLAPAAAPRIVDVRLEQRLTEALAAVERSGRPSIALVAVPSSPVSVRGFLERDAPVAQAIAAPPSIRQYGFDLDTGGRDRLVEGRVRRAVTPEYKLLEVWRDGVIQFIAPGDTDFLAWGRADQQLNGFRINPLVIAEATLMFMTFVQRVYGHVEPRPDRVTYQLHLLNARDAQGNLSRLVPYALGTIRWLQQESRVAPRADHVIYVELPRDSPPEVSAYELLREFYGWFGVDGDHVPYSDTQNARRFINADSIRNASG